MDATEILQQLHDSEINAQLSWFYDGSFRCELGDDLNGWRGRGTELTARAAIYALAETAFGEHPRSAFAEWWKIQRATLREPNSSG